MKPSGRVDLRVPGSRAVHAPQNGGGGLRRAPALVCLALWGSLSAAQASDGSAVNVIGFSPDGRFFAFEQYGERGGDGQLFSEIVTIDVRDDRYEEGPVVETWQPENEEGRRKRVQLTLEQVRQKAAAKAAPTLKRLGIAAKGAVIAERPEARLGDVLEQAQIGSVREAATATLPITNESLGPSARFIQRDLPMDVKRCENRVPDGKPKGIVVTLEREKRPPLTMTHDRNVPVARGCPDRYGLAAAYALPRADGAVAVAVFVQYFFYAFEGHARRFFAVTSAVR